MRYSLSVVTFYRLCSILRIVSFVPKGSWPMYSTKKKETGISRNNFLSDQFAASISTELGWAGRDSDLSQHAIQVLFFADLLLLLLLLEEDVIEFHCCSAALLSVQTRAAATEKSRTDRHFSAINLLTSSDFFLSLLFFSTHVVCSSSTANVADCLTSGFTSTAIQEPEQEQHPTWYAFARKQGKEEMRHCGSAWVRARER